MDTKSPNLIAQETQRLEACLIGVQGTFDWVFVDNLDTWRGPKPPRLQKRRRGWLSRLWLFYVVNVGLGMDGRERLHRVVRSLQPCTLLPDHNC